MHHHYIPSMVARNFSDVASLAKETILCMASESRMHDTSIQIRGHCANQTKLSSSASQSKDYLLSRCVVYL